MLSGTVLISGAVGLGTIRSSKLFVGDLEDEPEAMVQMEDAMVSRAGIRSSQAVQRKAVVTAEHLAF